MLASLNDPAAGRRIVLTILSAQLRSPPDHRSIDSGCAWLIIEMQWLNLRCASEYVSNATGDSLASNARHHHQIRI